MHNGGASVCKNLEVYAFVVTLRFFTSFKNDSGDEAEVEGASRMMSPMANDMHCVQ